MALRIEDFRIEDFRMVVFVFRTPNTSCMVKLTVVVVHFCHLSCQGDCDLWPSDMLEEHKLTFHFPSQSRVTM